MDEVIKKAIAKLKKRYSDMANRRPKRGHLKKIVEFQKGRGITGGEIFFVPEAWFYDEVLSIISKDDVVFDVGAGDLRFDLMLSEKAKNVYAVEINPVVLGGALRTIGFDMPLNLVAMCGNAFEMELPRDVTVVTCLMIHRQHEFPEYWKHCRIIYATKEGVKENGKEDG